MKVTLTGQEPFQRELSRLGKVELDRIAEKSAVEMFNRAKGNSNPSAGGTPVDSRELQKSVTKVGKGAEAEIGYTKEYAPHVEIGHRTRGGGYVQGQKFLKRNVEIQEPIFKREALAELRGK